MLFLFYLCFGNSSTKQKKQVIMKKYFVYRVEFWICNTNEKTKFHLSRSFTKLDDAMSLISIIKVYNNITDIVLHFDKSSIEPVDLPF